MFHMYTGARGDQNTGLAILEQRLQVSVSNPMWVPGTECRSSGRREFLAPGSSSIQPQASLDFNEETIFCFHPNKVSPLQS